MEVGMTQRLRPDRRCPVLSLPVPLGGLGKFLIVPVPQFPPLNKGDNTASPSYFSGKINMKPLDAAKKRH